jgi:pimeloyl-ACP methyl ester carboxylesterase
MNGPARGGQSLAIHDIQMYFETAGAGEPLLFLHGFSGIGSDWDYVSTEVPTGHRLILPDLRGHGRSTNPSPEFSFRQSALDVFAPLDALAIDKFQAIGVSGGGQTLLHMATQQPSRVDAMVLVSTAHYFPEQEWTAMRRRHLQGDDQIRALWRQAHDLKDSFADVNFTPPYLSTITARTLIVHGDRDPLYPIDIACEMYRSIPGARLWIVPNAGHGMIFQKQAPHFVETAVAFFGERS